MGVWESGVFESDYALDVLGTWIQRIISEITEAFKNLTEDNFDEDEILANVDILATLFDHYKIYPDLEMKEVERWKSEYLSLYDNISQDPDDVEYVNKRREMVTTTFDKLHHTLDEVIKHTKKL